MRDRPHRLRLVHAAARQLGLDDAAYRSLLAGAAGVTSAADLATDRQWAAVVRALRALGWRGTGRLQGPEATAYALWRRLYDRGVVRRRTHQAFRAWVTRMAGAQDIYRADQWAVVINSLRSWVQRAESSQISSGSSSA